MTVGEPLFPDWGDQMETQVQPVHDACALLGIPENWTDSDGYEHEIEGAALTNENRKIAWIESRRKMLDGFEDVTYRLKARVGGEQFLDWEVDTYNPFFGCDVGYMHWWGDRIVVVYREKHHMMLCSIDVSAEPLLLALSDDWRVVDDVVYYESEERGLVEALSLPEIVRCPPCSEVQLRGVLDGNSGPVLSPSQREFPNDPTALQDALREALWQESAPAPEADLLIGALAFRFWDNWPRPAHNYAQASPRRWNSPTWLPFYWYKNLPARDADSFLGMLESIGSRTAPAPSPKDDSTTAVIKLASAHISSRCKELAQVCRVGSLPEHSYCYFWVDRSHKEFTKKLSLFPQGFQEAYRRLAKHKKQWQRLGESC